MSAKTMAEVLAGHQLKLGVRDMLLHCVCGWNGSHFPEARGDFLKHQEAALTDAGFGLVTEMKAAALDQSAMAVIESEGRKLAAAILARRLRKCIAQDAHQPDAAQGCPRCGLPQSATEMQPNGQPPTEVTPTTTEGRTDRCHGPEWETPQRTTPPRSPSSNISLPTKGL